MAPNLLRSLLALAALNALVRGKSDERQVGLIFVVGVIATELVLPAPAVRFASVETHLLLVDIAVFLGFTWVALRSERFWPLWIAGLQLTAIFGHMLKAVDVGLFSRAYAAALVFWAYPMLLILALGTWRGQRRRARQGASA